MEDVSRSDITTQIIARKKLNEATLGVDLRRYITYAAVKIFDTLQRFDDVVTFKPLICLCRCTSV